jgi:O-antigen/teichoic acid export membrane protein
MDSQQRHLSRGFNWLGGATIIARVVDFSTILVVLAFLTKEQVGVASLVISIGMIVESLDGLGTGDALVQASAVSSLQRDTLFWFVLGAAVLVGVLTILAAPLIEAVYGVTGMAGYFVMIAAKQPLVGAAVIPLAMMNRDLQYERIAMVNVGATFAAAMVRLALAMSGAGTWALVIGFAASGFFTLIGAWIAKPFRPHLQFRMPEIATLLRFGTLSAASNAFEQTFKNIDYLLVGWFYGAASLAVYRVAFDVAMEPAMAVGTLVNRTALPVFAKVAAIKRDLAQTLTWSLERLVLLTAPLSAGLMLAADPLTALLHDDQGHSYAAAALPLKILAAAALLRVTAFLLLPVMMGSGRPGTAARLSAATLVLLGGGILIGGVNLPAPTGIVAVSAVWLVVYALLLLWGAAYLRRHWDIEVATLARAFMAPVAGIGALALAALAARLLLGNSDPRLQLGVVIAATALAYAGLFLHARARRVS